MSDISQEEFTKYNSRMKQQSYKYPEEFRDDLVQHCWEVYLTKKPKFEGTEKEWEHYITQIIKYRCLDYMEKYVWTHKSPVIDFDIDNRGDAFETITYVADMKSLDSIAYTDDEGTAVSFAELADSGVDTDAYMDAREELEVLKASISPEHYRTLELYHDHGYTLAEIVCQYPELGFNSTSALDRFINSFKQ